jgi:biofilm PGA synthesis lipoprotein PgaB
VIFSGRVVLRLFLFAPLLVWQGASAADIPSHLVVLQYHHVSASTPASTSISPERFRQHMQWLADNDFSVVALPEAVRTVRAGESLPDRTVAITFDDGYINNYDEAFPVLRERGWPFTIFVNSDPVDAGRKAWVSWDQIREMADSGANILNHTKTHAFLIRRLDGESEAAWLQRIEEEIEVAEARILEETGQTEKILGYPYGESDLAVRALVDRLGYIAFGQQSGPVGAGSDFTDLPRFPLSGPYSAMDSYQTKMRSLPMPVVAIEPQSRSGDGVLFFDETRPTLEFGIALEGRLPPLNCFASGQGAIPVIGKAVGSYSVTAPEPLPVGRSRYNCTLASGIGGRYYWYSYPWVRRGPENQWVHQ